jgi:dTMP kinase
LDVDVETGLKRRQAGGGEWNRLDDYDLAFHQRVRAGYHELAKQEPDRWVTVDARQSKEEIQTAIRKILKIRLALSS